MTRSRRPGAVRFATGMLIAAALVATSCTRGGDDANEAAKREGAVHAVAGTPGAPSLFELTFAFTDQAGRTRHLSEFRGAPFVASMIYTSCTSVCPRVTADLKSLEQALPVDERARMRFVLFSLDPARDTPAALRAFAAEHALATDRWTLLAAQPDDMRTLAAVLGMRFRPEENGEIAHSALIVVVDSAGVIRHRQLGLRDDRDELVAAVRGVR